MNELIAEYETNSMHSSRIWDLIRYFSYTIDNLTALEFSSSVRETYMYRKRDG